MSPLLTLRRLSPFVAVALATQLAWSADSGKNPTTNTGRNSTAAARPGAARSTAGKGPLPDPVLLDGSNQPAEKKSEYGMIGDFELPGDENAREGKVGGTQNPGQQPGGGGLPNVLPQGGAGPQSQQAAAKQGEGGGAQPQGGQQKAEDKAGGGGAGEPGAKPEGVQVAELGGEPSGQSAAGAGEKPPPVAIGDSAMRIPASQSAAGVVGGQQQRIEGNTQHHEKGTGSGGKGPTGVQGNNRVEKGRTIPSGL